MSLRKADILIKRRSLCLPGPITQIQILEKLGDLEDLSQRDMATGKEKDGFLIFRLM
ncbi:hypothetical protein Ocin01_01073 [Orchesella cincta]|uniref:Uncharacterized protein n=1 Tax=Orchesella cincta TaxID=48709 RepID=A0A1D2NK27_ORCCI|nr:hypothetical protein Ocin01_01073 [Orchesella cincta]